MHPTITHHLALIDQRHRLDQAAADRLARIATAGRPSMVARLMAALRRGAPVTTRRPEPRSAARSTHPGGI